MSKVKRKPRVRKSRFSLFSYSGAQQPSDDSDDSDYKPTAEETIPTNKKYPIPVLKLSTDSTGQVFRCTEKKVSSDKPKKRYKKSGKVKINSHAERDYATNHSHALADHPQENHFWFTQLPDECQLRIFQFVIESEGTSSFLSRIPLVCKHWDQISRDSVLYRHVDLSRTPKNQKNESISRFFKEKVGHVARYINLSGWSPKITQLEIATIIENCPHLRHVNLSGCNALRDHHMQLLSDHCPQLTSVELSHLKAGKNAPSPLSARPLKHMFCKLGENLKHFSVANNFDLNLPGILDMIGETCHNLRVLDISNVKRGGGYYTIHIENLQKGCPTLQVLRLANTSIALQQVPLLEQAASHGFPKLEELSIAMLDMFNAPLITSSCIERILKTSEKLKLLDLRGRTHICASSLVKLPAWNLEHLFLSKCSAPMSLLMQKWCHSLKEVDISWNLQSGDAIDNAVNALSMCSTPCCLHTLDLSGSAVSFEAVKNIVQKCLNIRFLNLSSCRGLPRGIKRKFEGSTLEQLKDDIAALKYDTLGEV